MIACGPTTGLQPVRQDLLDGEESRGAEAGYTIMYQSSYAEHLEESPGECRDRERRAFDLAIELLQDAQAAGMPSSRSHHALHYLCRLWRTLLEDLVSPDNDLPDSLRADLVSIGIWVIKEAASIGAGQSSNFRGVIDICAIVRDGLK